MELRNLGKTGLKLSALGFGASSLGGVFHSLNEADGIRAVQTVRPRLTTIRQNNDAMGRQAALRLIDHIDHPNTAISDSILIPTTLIEGESLAAAPKGL